MVPMEENTEKSLKNGPRKLKLKKKQVGDRVTERENKGPETDTHRPDGRPSPHRSPEQR